MYKLKKTCSGVLMVTQMQDASDEDQSENIDIQGWKGQKPKYLIENQQ